jgi:hypothetical protein
MGLQFQNLFLRTQALVATMSGQNYSVWRPNYTQQDQTPVLIQSDILLKVETAGTRFADPRYPIIQYYSVFGDRALFQPGDILKTNEARTTSTTPPVTVIQYSPVEECMAVRTSRVADIGISTGNIIAHNVYYDFEYVSEAQTGFQGSFSGSFDRPIRKICMFTRPQLLEQLQTYDIQGLRLIETDGVTQTRWVIKALAPITNIIEAVIEQEQ